MYMGTDTLECTVTLYNVHGYCTCPSMARHVTGGILVTPIFLYKIKFQYINKKMMRLNIEKKTRIKMLDC